jgi:hypothetical protein
MYAYRKGWPESQHAPPIAQPGGYATFVKSSLIFAVGRAVMGLFVKRHLKIS